MKLRNLMLAALLLAALTGALYWSNRHPPASSTGGAAIPKIMTEDPADITAIKVDKKGQGEVALAKDSAGNWQIGAPIIAAADQDAAGALVNAITPLYADRIVEDKPADLKPYGLDDPSVTLEITEKGGKIQKLMLGGDSAVGGGAFASLAGDPRVFVVSNNVKTGLDKGLSDLRDAHLVRIDPEAVSKIDLTAKNQDVEFVRDKDKNVWQITKPPAVRTDPMAVDAMVRGLADAKFDPTELGDDKQAAAAFASGTPFATLAITAPSGAQHLEIRKSQDAYYAKSSEVDGVYKVSNDVALALNNGVDDFRNKNIFDFGYETPSKFEVRDGAKTYAFTRMGQQWWSDGKKVDIVSTLVLVDKIRALSAAKVVTSGFSAPLIDISITSNDGTRTEKAQIAKSGDGYVAKLDGQSQLFALPAPAVQDLQTALAAIKPSDADAPTPQ